MLWTETKSQHHTNFAVTAKRLCFHFCFWLLFAVYASNFWFQYLLSVSAFSTCFQYLLSVPASSICFQYLLPVSAFSTYFQYLLPVSAFSICFQYLLSAPTFSIPAFSSSCNQFLFLVPLQFFSVPFHFHFHILASYPGPFEKSFSPIFQMGLGTRLFHIRTLTVFHLNFHVNLCEPSPVTTGSMRFSSLPNQLVQTGTGVFCGIGLTSNVAILYDKVTVNSCNPP